MLVNNTNVSLRFGLTLSGDLLVVQEGVQPGNEAAQLNVHPTFYIALFRSIKKGQMVDSAIVIRPVMLQYKDGYTAAEVSAVIENGKTVLQDPVLAYLPLLVHMGYDHANMRLQAHKYCR